MNRLLTVALVLAAVWAAAAGKQRPPGPLPEPIREIHVPFEQLHLLLKSAPESVMLQRAEFDALTAAAKRRTQEKPPLDRTITQAQYTITVGERNALLDARCRVESLAEQPGLLELPVQGVGLHTVNVEGMPAALYHDPAGRVALRLPGKGEYSVIFTGDIAVASTAARQTLSFRLPAPAPTSLVLRVPGDVELKSGGAVIERVFDSTAQLTTMTLAPQDAPMDLSLSLNSRRRQNDLVVIARSVFVDEITEAYERLHATISFDIMHRAVERVRFAVPSGMDVMAVTAPEVSTWQLTEQGDNRVLEVEMRDAVSGRLVLNVLCTAPPRDPGLWSFPRFEPLDVTAAASVLGVLLDTRLEAKPFQTEGVISIGTGVLTSALPRSVLAAEPGAPSVRPVAAFFAPNADSTVATTIERPAAAVACETDALMTVAESGLQLLLTVRVVPRYEPCFGLEFTLPDGWDITEVTRPGGEAVPFEQERQTNGRLRVRFPAGIPANTAGALVIKAENVPENWLNKWTEQVRTIAFPMLTVPDAVRSTGALRVKTQDDLTARTAAAQHVTVLDENTAPDRDPRAAGTQLAYRFDTADAQLTLDIVREKPRLTAETYSFFRFDGSQTVQCRYELIYDIGRAHTNHLLFDLPPGMPTAISVAGVTGCQVKEFSSELLQDGPRRWTVILDGPKIGRVHIAVDVQLQTDTEEAGPLSLPVVRAAGVAYQSGRIAVEGSAELDCSILSHPRRIDVGELVDAAYRPGPRLLGVFGFTGDNPEVTVSVKRHDGYGLPDTIVQRANLTTSCSRTGICQTAAEYKLRTKADAIEILLPAGATLWSVMVDGKAIAPQGRNGAVLVPLPPQQNSPDRVLKFVYESESPEFALRGRVCPAAPRLAVDSASGERLAIPAADLRWTVTLPRGYRLNAAAGTVTPTAMPTRTPALVLLGRWVFLAGGGIDFNHGIVGMFLGSLSQARQKARAISEISERKARLLEQQLAQEAAAGDMTAPQAAAEQLAEPPRAVSPWGGEKQAKAKQKTAELYDFRRKDVGAIEGARSLDISLVGMGTDHVFTSLGREPALVLTVTDERALRGLAWFAFLAVFVGGCSLGGTPWRRKRSYLVTVLLVSSLAGAVSGAGAATSVFNGAFAGGCILIPVYLVGALLRRFMDGARHTHSRLAAAAGLVALLCAGHNAAAQAAAAAPPAPVAPAAPAPAAPRPPEPAAPPADVPASEAASAGARPADTSGGPYSVELVQPLPLTIPENTVVVPYGMPGAPDLRRVLVPYSLFSDLWTKTHPEDQMPELLREFPCAVSAIRYEAALDDSGALRIAGTMSVEMFVDSVVELPFTMAGCILAHATVDGQPALLRREPAPQVRAAQMQQAVQIEEHMPDTALKLYLSGKGTHTVAVEAHVPVTKRGGWRQAAATLPATTVTELALSVPHPGTEINATVRNRTQTLRTEQPDRKIAFGLGPSGKVELHWRPRLGERDADRTLTVDSEADFDIQEDMLRLVWKPTFTYRDGERDIFSVAVPAAYRVESVTGTNVRGWETAHTGDEKTITVTLLKAAERTATFELTLWGTGIGPNAQDVPVRFPAVRVESAARHTGRLLVRHSPLLELTSRAGAGVQRVDLPETADEAGVQSDSPIGLRPYEAYNALTMPPDITLTATAVPVAEEVSVRSIIRIGRRQRTIESLLQINAKRPLFTVGVTAPEGFEAETVSTPGISEWTVTGSGPDRRIAIRFADGMTGPLSVVVQGRVDAPLESGSTIPLAAPIATGATRQRGHVVVLSEPGFRLQEQALKNLKRIPLQQVAAWLAPAQLKRAQAAFGWDGGAYAGTVTLTPIPTQADYRAVTNLRLTDRSVEETVLIMFQVRRGGLREVTLHVPDRLADARYRVPMLRQKTVTPQPQDGRATVLLEFQERMTGDFTLLIEHDRPLGTENEAVSLVNIETGTPTQQGLVIESAGRDEVVVDEVQGLDPVGMQTREWNNLVALLKGDITYAFAVQSAGPDPLLRFHAERRAAVETAGARIGLARTLLMVDAAGTFRGSQTYLMDNQTEQFLVIRMPPHAALWTARVGTELVKPVQADADTPDTVSIPIVKTAEGDLDYRVELKYGGHLPAPGPLERIDFPLIRTVNINVERSQVELLLPPQYDWVRFEGTMRAVKREAEFQAGYLNYQTQVAKRLVQALQAGNEYAKVRASANLGLLSQDIRQSQIDALTSSGAVREAVGKADAVLSDVEQRLGEQDRREAGAQEDNRQRMNVVFSQQKAQAPSLQTQTETWNWDRNDTKQAGSTTRQFNDAWLANNALAEQTGEELSAVNAPGEKLEEAKKAKADKPQQVAAGRVVQMGQQPQAPPPPAKLPQIRFEAAGKQRQAIEKEAPPPAKPESRMRPERERTLDRYREQLNQRGLAQNDRKRQNVGQPDGMPDTFVDRDENGVANIPVAGGTVQGWGPGAMPAATGLASLDLALPEQTPGRWTVHRFTTPRGDIQVRGWGLKVDFLRMLWRVGLVLVLAVVFYGVRHWLASGGRGLGRVSGSASWLIFGGVIGLLFGVLPVFSLVIALVGIVMAAVGRNRRRSMLEAGGTA